MIGSIKLLRFLDLSSVRRSAVIWFELSGEMDELFCQRLVQNAVLDKTTTDTYELVTWIK